MATFTPELMKEEILNVIQATVESSEWPRSREKRTWLLKDALCELGHQKRLAVFTSGTKKMKPEFHEWLWDFVWADQTKKKQRDSGYHIIKRLPLIAEIEWGTSEADRMDDFEKLRFGDADLCLFVCGSEGREDFEKAVKLCKKTLCKEGHERRAHYFLVAVNTKSAAIDGMKSWVW